MKHSTIALALASLSSATTIQIDAAIGRPSLGPNNGDSKGWDDERGINCNDRANGCDKISNWVKRRAKKWMKICDKDGDNFCSEAEWKDWLTKFDLTKDFDKKAYYEFEYIFE